MGGKSYSYVDLENGYGKFYGIASSDGGGFSAVGTVDYSQDSWQEYDQMKVIKDLSGYDGLVIEVSSQDPRTFKFDLTDDRRRFVPSAWEAMYEVPGGF